MFSRLNYTVLFKEAFLHLCASKLRSLLALLGTLVGTVSVVAMVSSGQLATAETLKQFELLGTDLFALTLSPSEETDGAGAPTAHELNLPEAESIHSVDPQIEALAPYTQIFNLWQFQQMTGGTSILGVTGPFARIAHLELAEGRFISKLDEYQYYCVIGHQIYEQIKQHTFKDVMGQQIVLGQTIFTIIGVLRPWTENSFLEANMDSSIMVPVLTSTLLGTKVGIRYFLMRLKPHADLEALQNHLTHAISTLAPNQHVYFRSAKELIAKRAKQGQILTVFLGLIGGVSLLVGGIGVMNIMLVSVVERRREIGVRLAVGATSSDIGWLFLIEALLLSLTGGTLGVLIGIIIAYGMALFWQWHFVLYFLPVFLGFAVSAAVGIFFGFYPAYQASTLDPVQALRG